MYERIYILIPAYNPEEALIKLTDSLLENGFSNIVVVNDGSHEKSREVFSKVQERPVTLLTHEVNKGKGQALKTGFEHIAKNCPDCLGVITIDCDGQHTLPDIINIANIFLKDPSKVILGTRDFSDKELVPWRSRFGNKMSSLFFYLDTGVKVGDTQTGLRAIPSSLFETALTTEGTRYEYEMNFLSTALKKAKAEGNGFTAVKITTVYEDNNSGSHFRPVRDSVRVFGRFLKYILIALLSFLIDYGLFLCFKHFLKEIPVTTGIFIATFAARIISSIVNFVLNKLFCFKSKAPVFKEFLKYALLWCVNLLLSAGAVSVLKLLQIPEALGKPVVDIILFILNYFVQKNWVYKAPKTNS